MADKDSARRAPDPKTAQLAVRNLSISKAAGAKEGDSLFIDSVREVQKTGERRERKQTQRLVDQQNPHLALANSRRGNPTDFVLLLCDRKRITHAELAKDMVDININCKKMTIKEYIKYRLGDSPDENEVMKELIWFIENEHHISTKKKVVLDSRPPRRNPYKVPDVDPVSDADLLLENFHRNEKIQHIDPQTSMDKTLLNRNNDDGDTPGDKNYTPSPVTRKGTSKGKKKAIDYSDSGSDSHEPGKSAQKSKKGAGRSGGKKPTHDDTQSGSDSDQEGNTGQKPTRAAPVAVRKEKQPWEVVQSALMLVLNGSAALFVSVGSNGTITYRVLFHDLKMYRLPAKTSTFLKICQNFTPSHGLGVMIHVQSMFQSGFFKEVVQRLSYTDVPPTRNDAGIKIDTDFFQGKILSPMIDEIMEKNPESTNALRDVISIMTDPSQLTAFVNKTGSALPTLDSEREIMREMKALTNHQSRNSVVKKFEAEFKLNGLSKEGREFRKNRGDVLKAMGVVDDRLIKKIQENETDRMLDLLAKAFFDGPDLTWDQIDPTLKIWFDLSKLDGTLESHSDTPNVETIIARSKKAKRMCDMLISAGGGQTRLIEKNFKQMFNELDLTPSVMSAVNKVRKQHPDLFQGYEKIQELDTYFKKGCMRDFPSCLDIAYDALKAGEGHGKKVLPVLKVMIENVLKKKRCPNNFHEVWARFQGTVSDLDRMDYSQVGMHYWEAAYKDLMLLVGKEVNSNDKTLVKATPNLMTPDMVIESIIISGFMAVLSERDTGSSDTGDGFFANLKHLNLRADSSPEQREKVCDILERFASDMSKNKLLQDNIMSLRHVPMDTYVEVADLTMDYARCNDELTAHFSDLGDVYPTLKLRMVKHAMVSILYYINHPDKGTSKAALKINQPMHELFFRIGLDLTEDDPGRSSPAKETAKKPGGKGTSGKHRKEKRNSDQISDGDKQSEPPEPTQKKSKVTEKPPQLVEPPASAASVQPQNTGARGPKPVPANKSRKLSVDTINSLLPLVLTELKELLGQHGCQIPHDRTETVEGIIKRELGRPKCTTTHPASIKIPSPEHGIRTFSDMTDYLKFPSVDAAYYKVFQEHPDLFADPDSQRKAFLVQIAIKLYSEQKTGGFPDCLRQNFMRRIL